MTLITIAATAMKNAKTPATIIATNTAIIPSPMSVPMKCAMFSLPFYVDSHVTRTVSLDDTVRVTRTDYQRHARISTDLAE